MVDPSKIAGLKTRKLASNEAAFTKTLRIYLKIN